MAQKICQKIKYPPRSDLPEIKHTSSSSKVQPNVPSHNEVSSNDVAHNDASKKKGGCFRKLLGTLLLPLTLFMCSLTIVFWGEAISYLVSGSASSTANDFETDIWLSIVFTFFSALILFGNIKLFKRSSGKAGKKSKNKTS